MKINYLFRKVEMRIPDIEIKKEVSRRFQEARNNSRPDTCLLCNKKLTKLYIKDGVIDKKLHDELFDIMKSQKHYFDSLAKVSPERKRLENPHSYKVDLSSDLINLKYGLINKIKNV